MSSDRNSNARENGHDDAPSWGQFLQEMESVASEYEERGWETTIIVAGAAEPVLGKSERVDTHGLAYVISGEEAQDFVDVFVPGGFPRTEVYAARTERHVFLLTVLLDTEADTAILLSGAFEGNELSSYIKTAKAEGSVFTHLFHVNGTHLGSFEHENPELFIPMDK